MMQSIDGYCHSPTIFFFCPRKGCLTIIAMTFNVLIIHADTFYLSFSQWNEFDAEGGGSGDGGDSKRREEKKEIITIGIEWNVTGNVIVCATVIFWQFWLRRSETSGVGGVAQLLSRSRYVAQGSKSLCVSSPQYASLASVEEKQRKKIYIEEMLVLVDRVLTATNKNDFYRD